MRRALLALVPLLLSGCILDYGRCTYEHRSMVMKGHLAGAGQPAGELPIAAELSLNETRDGPNDRTLALHLDASSAMSILSVDVVDAGSGNPVLLAHFPTGNTMTPGSWYATLSLGYDQPPPSHSRLKWAAGRDDLRLIARYVSGATAEGSLRITEDGDWESPYCS